MDSRFNELNATHNGSIAISFFHSHCRLKECNLCKNMHLIVTANEYLKICLLSKEQDAIIDCNNLSEC